MINKGIWRLPLILFIVFVCSPAMPETVFGQEVRDQIAEEIRGLEEMIPLHFSKDQQAKKRGQDFLDDLREAESILQSGYLYWSLKQLQVIARNWLPLIYQNEKVEVANAGQEAFEKEWQTVGEELKEKQKQYTTVTLKIPAVVKALAQDSFNQAGRFYESSRLQGLNTNTKAGLYYLGRSRAFLNFALFCQRLNFGEVLPTPRQRSIESEIQALEQKVVMGYQNSDFGKQGKRKDI